MLLPLNEALLFLEHYKYLVIFPIAIIEGPIIIIISGFLVYLGFLNAVVAFVLLVVADVTGDVIYYFIGRYGRNSKWVKKSLSVLGYTDKSQAFLENHFSKHFGKTFLLSKFSHGVGAAIQMASGIAKSKFEDFIVFSFIGTIPKTILLLYLGYFLGSSYVKINGYLDHVALITVSLVALVVLGYYLTTKYVKRTLSKEITDNSAE